MKSAGPLFYSCVFSKLFLNIFPYVSPGAIFSYNAPTHTRIKSFTIFLTNSRISRIHTRILANKVQPVKAMMHRRIHIIYFHRTINVIIKYVCYSSVSKSLAYCAQSNAQHIVHTMGTIVKLLEDLI